MDELTSVLLDFDLIEFEDAAETTEGDSSAPSSATMMTTSSSSPAYSSVSSSTALMNDLEDSFTALEQLSEALQSPQKNALSKLMSTMSISPRVEAQTDAVLIESVEDIPAERQWFYIDMEDKVQGPFSDEDMMDWYEDGFFSLDIPVRRKDATQYELLGSFFLRGDSAFLEDIPELAVEDLDEFAIAFKKFGKRVVHSPVRNKEQKCVNDVHIPTEEETLSMQLKITVEKENRRSASMASVTSEGAESDSESFQSGFRIPRNYRSPSMEAQFKELSSNSKRLSSANDCNSLYAQYIAQKSAAQSFLSVPVVEEDEPSVISDIEEDEEDDHFEFLESASIIPSSRRSASYEKVFKELTPNSKRLSSAVDCNDMYARYLATKEPPSNAASMSSGIGLPSLIEEEGENDSFASQADAQSEQDAVANEKKAVDVRNRGRLIDEILSTEKSYVESLSVLINCFIQPLKSAQFRKALGIADHDNASLFSNVETIYSLHCSFLSKLIAGKEENNLFEVFLKNADFLKIYTDYVSKYDTQCIRTLQHLSKNKKFQLFLEETMVDERVRGQTLTAFLIMPVQRIPRYEMLLNNVLKLTAEDHTDFAALRMACDKLKAIACHVNENKRLVENMDKVYRIQMSIKGMDRVLMQPHRHFIRKH